VHLNSPYVFAKTSSADDQAFKFNATGILVTDITVDPHTPLLTADAGAFNGDGTGNFGFGIICLLCGPGTSNAFTTDIVFHVANASVADLTTPNNLGNVFVADIGAPCGGASQPACAGSSGFNTGPADAVVPDGGSTVTLLGSVLLGLGMLRRRFGKS
jgi:hypothetical protein